MASEDKTIELLIKAQALTKQAFEEARKDIAAVRGEADKARPSTLGLRDAMGGLKTMAGALGIGLGISAIVSFGKSVFAAASEIHDMALAMGISIEAAQRFKFAAEQGGATAGDVERAIHKMNQELAGGSLSTVQALTDAGLSFDEVRAMKPEDAFLAIVDAVQKIPDPMKQAEVMTALFGKTSLALLPQVKEGFREAADAAKVMSEETVKRLEASQQSWENFWNRVTIISGEAIAKIGQTMDRATERDQRADKVRALAIRDNIAMQEAWQRVYRATAGEQERFFRTGSFEAKQATDVLLSFDAAQKKTADGATYFANELKAAQSEVAKLTKAQRDGIAAAKLMGTSTDDIAQKFKISHAALRVLDDQIKKHEESQRKASQATKEWAENTLKFQQGMAKAQQTLRDTNLIEWHKHFTSELEKNRLKLKETGDAWVFVDKWIKQARLEQRDFIQEFEGSVYEREMRKLNQSWDAQYDAILRSQNAAGQYGQALDQLAQVSTGAFGTIVGGLADVFSAWDRATQAVIAYRKQGGATNADKAGALISGAASVLGATGSGNTVQRTVSGAAAGATAGLAIGAAFAPATLGLSLAIGAIGGAVVGLVRGLGQLTDYQKRVREEAALVTQLKEDALKAAGSMDKLRQMASLVGIEIDSAFKSRDPKWLAQVLTDVHERTQKLNAAMEEYGFTWEDLPVKARQSQMIELAETLLEKTDLLKGAGIDHSEILRRQEKDYAELIRTAVRTETELPAAMRAPIEKLREMGLLLNDNGEEMEELGKVTFAKTMTEGFQDVTKELKNIAGLLMGQLPQALDGVFRGIPRRIDIEVHARRTGDGLPGDESSASDGPGHASGTPNLDFVDFGRASRTVLHGREAVIPQSGVGQLAAQIAGALSSALAGPSLTFHVAAGADAAAFRAAGEEIAGIVTDVIRRGGTPRHRLQLALGVS